MFVVLGLMIIEKNESIDIYRYHLLTVRSVILQDTCCLLCLTIN